MSDNSIPLLIDTDPGVDDALAILMAFDDLAHEVIGLTIVAGNVGLKHTVANALKLCEVAGRGDIPVFAGCAEPLLHPAPDAADVHGADGFGDIGYTQAARAAEAEHLSLIHIWPAQGRDVRGRRHPGVAVSPSGAQGPSRARDRRR